MSRSDPLDSYSGHMVLLDDAEDIHEAMRLLNKKLARLYRVLVKAGPKAFRRDVEKL